MSFSSDCKEELCRLPLEKSCCLSSELSAFYMTVGSLHLLGKGQVNVKFTLDNTTIAKRVYTLLQKGLLLTPQIYFISQARFGGIRKCVLSLDPRQSPSLLSRFLMMKTDQSGQSALYNTNPRIPLQRSCCMRSFLRGTMLGSGMITRPEHGYRLTLLVKDDFLQFLIIKCFHRFMLPIKQSSHKQITLFYLTKGEHVITFLTLIGAYQTVISLENLRVQREVFGDINRAMNCDSSNIKKLIKASENQLNYISRLLLSENFTNLSPSLQEIAKARIRAPDASFEELGQMLSPPISKSGVNHRMRRLMENANRLLSL